MSRQLALKSGGLLAVLLVLAGVFALYLQPDFLFTLASQVWACF